MRQKASNYLGEAETSGSSVLGLGHVTAPIGSGSARGVQLLYHRGVPPSRIDSSAFTSWIFLMVLIIAYIPHSNDPEAPILNEDAHEVTLRKIVRNSGLRSGSHALTRQFSSETVN